MYYDFQLNENGDILFKQSDRSDSFLQFDFFVAKTNGLVFDFYVDTYEQREYLQDLKPGFVFEFCIDNPDKDKEIVCIEDKNDYLYQQIKIRLSSALGTIKGNESLGSTLDNYRHMLLNPDKKKDYKDIEVIREETEKGKEYGLLMGTAYTIKSVAKKKKPLHPSTVSAYNWILETYFKQEG